MSAAATATIKAPLPADVDAQADAFHQLELEIGEAKKKLLESQKQLNAREAELIELVRSFGGPHATKSKILHGMLWELVATFAKFSTQDSGAVERFRQALVTAKKGRLLKKLFDRDVRWTMKTGAGQILAAEELSPRIKAELLGMLMLCSTEKDKAPSLDVRKKNKTA